MARNLIKTISLGKRNLIINGDMQIAQRGLTATPTAAFQYLLDRHVGWVTNPGNITGETMSQTALPASFPGVSDQTLGRAFRMNGTLIGNAAYNRMQRVESIRLKDGGKQITTVSAGVWVYSNNFQNAYISIRQATGAGSQDDWTTDIVVDSDVIPLTNNTWIFVSLENVSLPTTKGIEFRLILADPLANVSTDTYTAEMMLNSGPVVEPFNTMAGNIDGELRLCQRYYEKTYGLGIFPGALSYFIGAEEHRNCVSSGGSASHNYVFKVQKRITPTMAYYRADTGVSALPLAVANATLTINDAINDRGGYHDITEGATLGGQSLWHWTADAEL